MTIDYQFTPSRVEVRFESIAIMNEFLSLVDALLQKAPDTHFIEGKSCYHNFYYSSAEIQRLRRIYDNRQIAVKP